MSKRAVERTDLAARVRSTDAPSPGQKPMRVVLAGIHEGIGGGIVTYLWALVPELLASVIGRLTGAFIERVGPRHPSTGTRQ